MRSRRRVLALTLLGLVSLAGCSGSASLRFPRSDVSVQWQVRGDGDRAWVESVARNRWNRRWLDAGDRYPKQLAGWRDGSTLRSLLVVPAGAVVDGGRNVTVESARAPWGHRVVLASVPVARPDRTVVVRWGDGMDQRFTVVESPR